MNRIDFMNRLGFLLSDIPESERKEALQYYNDYLDDAGVENEEEVLSELGTPEEVAASIRDGLHETDGTQGEYSENGYRKAESQNRQGMMSGQADSGNTDSQNRYRTTVEGNDLNRRYRGGKKKRSGGMTALLIILCILAAPVVLPVAVALFVALMVVLFTLIVAAVVLLFVGVVCVIAGIVSFFKGLAKLVLFPAAAVMTIGMSIFTVGLGILLTLAIGWLLIKVFPKVFRALANFCSRLFHKKGGKRG